LKSFIREVESKYGEILSLSELYARDQKLGNEIILVRIMKLRVFEMLKIKFGPKEQEVRFKSFGMLCDVSDRLCGLVIRVSGYRYRGPGFDPRRYQIF